MPNWCVGNLKIRGKYKNIINFFEKELFILDGTILKREYLQPDIEADECSIFVPVSGDGLWFRNVPRSYFEENILIEFDDISGNEDAIITGNLGYLNSAWGIDVDSLTKLSKKYSLDFKIYAYERGMEFNIDYEVHSGKIIKANEIHFDDYVWECPEPNVGG